jgi:hypothetical protein
MVSNKVGLLQEAIKMQSSNPYPKREILTEKLVRSSVFLSANSIAAQYP